MTQCIDNQVVQDMIKTILYENLSISVIVPVLAEAKINIQPFGVDALLEKTIEIIPEMLQKNIKNDY